MSQDVEDRSSRIRITGLEAIPVGRKGYVKIQTNMDVTGWGEINNMETKVACALAESLSELIVGENPTRIEHHWQNLFRAHRNLRGGGFMMHTISAIDMALWDIAGKLWGVPVYRLLGGPTRDKIWMYPSPKAKKVGPGGPKPFAGTPDEVQALLQSIRKAREEVGPDGAVMYDAHSCLPPPIVKQMAGYLKADDLLFLEEAWVPGNIEAMRKVREFVPVPLATGERDRTIWEVREILEAQVIDILQPAPCWYRYQHHIVKTVTRLINNKIVGHPHMGQRPLIMPPRDRTHTPVRKPARTEIHRCNRPVRRILVHPLLRPHLGRFQKQGVTKHLDIRPQNLLYNTHDIFVQSQLSE